MKNNTWLLVANASKAKIYSFCKTRLFHSPNSKELALKEEHEHLDSRKKGTELLSDKLGGFGNGTFVEATTPKQHEATIFAKTLAEKLDDARKKNPGREFIIAATPAFLGLLKKHFSSALSRKAQFIEKDYTAHEGKQLMTDLMQYL